jgi:release factor glutamine methyltransferase
LRLAILDATRVLGGAGIESARADAELLAAHVVGVDRGKLMMHPLVDPPALEALRKLVDRRAAREPLQHLLGTAVLGPAEVAVGPGAG